MDLIDWAGVARNALWIVGLSVVLAAFSHTSWLAGQRGVRLRHALNWPGFQAAFALGMLLFTAGLAWSSTRLWERLAWLALLIAFGWQLVSAMLTIRRDRGKDSLAEVSNETLQ